MFMRIGCFAGICWSVVCLMVGVAPAVAAEPVGDPPAAMYEPDNVDVIRLTLPPASEQKLKEAPQADYVEGTFSIAQTEGTPQTTGQFSPPVMVGIRLKGGVGSFRPLDEKAAFKIKFNFENSKGEKGKKYLGLKKLTLNNMVQDKSFIHERLAYEALRSTGIPSPRTGYAYVEVNGEDFGLHLNIEAMDDVALEKRFGAFSHLYEATYGSDIEPEGPAFEVDEGDEEDISDLEALIAAVNGSVPAGFLDRVQPFADMVEMTRLWAAEHYIGHWDGYRTLNNYYLFSDLTDRFQMLPWGTDQTWVEHVPFGEGWGVMFTKCLQDADCAALYAKGLRQVKAAIAGVPLDSLATETAALLKPWEELEQTSSRHKVKMPEISAAVQETRIFIAARPADAVAWLAGKPEAPFATKVSVTLQPDSIPADGVSTTTATATVTDAGGNPVLGDLLEFSSSDPGVRFSDVVDNSDGTYTAQVISSTTAGAPTVIATDIWPNPDVAGSAVLTQTRGVPENVSVTLQPDSIPADGVSTTTATATVTDAGGNQVPGEQVELASTDPGQQIGAVVDNGDGTYSAQITSSTTVGTATITATDIAASLLNGSALLIQLPVQLSVQLAPEGKPPVPTQPPGQAPDPPTTTLTGKPSKRSRDRRPTFRFVSDQKDATFQCKLGGHAFGPCESPRTLARLALGVHMFSVRAVGAGGLIGPAASYQFTVRPVQPHRRAAGRRPR